MSCLLTLALAFSHTYPDLLYPCCVPFVCLLASLQLRTEVNKVMERARGEKLIGANLDACVYLNMDDVSDAQLRAALQEMACGEEEEGGGEEGNRVDSLKTVFLSSQVSRADGDFICREGK